MKSIRRFLGVVMRYRLFLIAAVICAALTSSMNTLGTLYIGQAVDAVGAAGGVDFPRLIQLLIWLGVLYGGAALFQWLLSLSSNRLAYRSVRDIRGRLFQKLNRLPLSYFDGNSHGDIISRFTNDLDSVSEAMAMAINSLFSGFVLVVTALFFMLRLNVTLTVVILVFTPVTFIVAYIVARTTHRTFSRQQQVVGELSGFVSESVGNEKVIIALGHEEKSRGAFEEINKRSYRTSQLAQFASSLINPTARFVDHLCYIAVALVGGLMAINGEVEIGIIASFLIYSSQFAKPFNEISGITVQLQTAQASLERVFAILDEKEEIPDTPDAVSLGEAEGNVDFEHVAFSYDPEKLLIRDLSLKAGAGNLIAIVGPTGSGKTTLVNLLMRFYEIGKGQISVDGNDIRNIRRDSLRQHFGMVLQDTWLFSGTVAENIAYARPDASREEVIAAAKSAHAHSFIKRLAKGYDTVISEAGGDLSGGQRQLLTIARVMLMDPPMLILDEATSSVDTLTEVRIQKALNKMMKGRTSFVIAHRLSTIVSADTILVLDQGDIVEQGSHRELLEKDGFYAKLYYSQFQ